jgi:hypothetical protein
MKFIVGEGKTSQISFLCGAKIGSNWRDGYDAAGCQCSFKSVHFFLYRMSYQAWRVLFHLVVPYCYTKRFPLSIYAGGIVVELLTIPLGTRQTDKCRPCRFFHYGHSNCIVASGCGSLRPLVAAILSNKKRESSLLSSLSSPFET